MKKLFNTKFKKFLWLAILIIAILSAIFIRTVPNYANKYGFEIVHLWDYNKYNQGYCLAENRILDKEELYKRAIKDHIEKEVMIWNAVTTETSKMYGYDDYKPDKYGFYLVEIFDNSNWFEFLSKNYIKHGALERISNAKEINNPMDYVVIDLENGIGGFSKPIIIEGNLYLDKSFLLLDKNYISLNMIGFVNEVTKYDKEQYLHNIKIRYNIELYNSDLKFDNCGKTKRNVEELIKHHIEYALPQ